MKHYLQKRSSQFALLMIVSIALLASSNNPPNGYTGAPFNTNGSCSSCHSGGNSYSGDITIDGLPAAAVPGTTYPLTLRISASGGNPNRGGFQLVVVDGANADYGDLIVPSGATDLGTEMAGGREYIDHRNPKNFSGNGSEITWNFLWKAEGTASGNTVKFYFAGNLCNGSGSNGDRVLTDLITIPVESAPANLTVDISPTNVLCFGGNTGSATASATGGTGAYTYLWNNNQTSATINNLVAGTYTVTATDSGGATGTASVVITQPASAIAIQMVVSGTITCASPTASITANVSGGTTPYTYAWANGNNDNVNEVTASGTYVVTVTDGNNCTRTASATVTSNTAAPVAVATGGVQSCLSGNASVSGTGSSTGANFSYLWTAPPGGIIVSGASSLNAVVSGIGDYVLQVTNNTNGCTTTATATVQASTPPSVTANGTTLTCANPSGTITASTTGQATYAWTGPNFTSNQQNPTVTATGTYTVTVTLISTGCTNTASVQVTGTNPPTVNASGTTLTCAAPTGAISVSTTSAGASYAWTGPNFTSNLQNPTVLAAGTYTVTVTIAGSGCTASATVQVVGNFTEPNLSVSTTAATCILPVSTATASSTTPGTTFQWTWAMGTSQQPTVQLGTGTYTVVATNPANGCTATATAVATSNTAAPVITISQGSLNCNTTQVTITATTNVNNPTYAWSGPGIISGSNSSAVTVNQAGPYVVTVTNTVNGCTSSETRNVTLDVTPPVASIATPGTLNCNTLAVTLNGAGSSQSATMVYQWTGPGVVSGANTLFPVVNAPGTYTLLVTNTANGCTATATATVVNAPAVSVLTSNTSVACFGGSSGTATAVGTGGNGVFSYTWSNNATGPSIGNLAAGTYFVTASDGNGCTATTAAVITQPVAALTPNATATNVSSQGVNNGTATANPTGGTNPYSYLWSNTATTSTIDNLAPGAYTVTVVDNNGCSAVQTVTVNSFNCNFSATLTAVNGSCNGSNDGSITVTPQNVVTPILYLWSNQATTQTVNNLAPGVYTVTVADATNCPVILSATISEPTALLVNVSITPETGNGTNDATATANVNGGTAPYNYLWSTSETTQTITGLTSGAYTVTVTDSKNCTFVQTGTVNAFNCNGSSALSITDVQCFGSANGSVTATYIGGTAPIVYNWSNGATTQTISNVSVGTYFLTMTDAAGCVLFDTAMVAAPAPLVAEITAVNNVSCPNEQNGSVVIGVTGGGSAPYSFTYPGANEPLLAVGVYTVTVTNPNGCTTTVDFSIIAIDVIAPTITCPANVAGCDTGNATNFAPPTIFDNCVPVGIQTTIIEGLPNGSYFPPGTTLQVYRVTDAAGNSSTCSFTVTTYPAPDVLWISSTDDVNGTGVGAIDVTPVMGTAPYTFNWTNNGTPYATTEDLSNLFAGKYFLTVTDANGCTVSLAPITIDNVVGTATPFSTAGIRLWPNPVMDGGQLHLTLSENIAPQSLVLINSTGQIVLVNNQLSRSNTIDISTLSAGVYIALLSDEQGKTYFANFIKQ